jgi:hypothetical protein
MHSSELDLQSIATAFADAMKSIDHEAPVWTSDRTGKAYQPGIGPHPETETVKLVAGRLASDQPSIYGTYELGRRYPSAPRQKCDWTFGSPLSWAVEVKMLRLMGDNGKPNDNMLMHILSPYPAHRSALTDIDKLATSGFNCRMAILIYGYDYPEWTMSPTIEAFEALAGRGPPHLSHRCSSSFDGLVHPIHRSGQVVTWEIEQM